MSTLAVLHCFNTYYARFYLVLVSEVFWGYFRYFRSFWDQIAWVRGLDTMIEDETRVSKHSQALQVNFEGLAKLGDHYTATKNTKRCHSAEWPSIGEWVVFFTWLESKPSWNGEWEEFGRISSIRPNRYVLSGEWMKKPQESYSNLLESTNPIHFSKWNTIRANGPLLLANGH